MAKFARRTTNFGLNKASKSFQNTMRFRPLWYKTKPSGVPDPKPEE